MRWHLIACMICVLNILEFIPLLLVFLLLILLQSKIECTLTKRQCCLRGARLDYVSFDIFWCSMYCYHEWWFFCYLFDLCNSYLAPVPLSIFRSNSKFDENSECSSFEYTRPITTIFCTRHDSDTVVTCAKYRCDRPRILYTRVFWIFIEFRIRSKYA